MARVRAEQRRGFSATTEWALFLDCLFPLEYFGGSTGKHFVSLYGWRNAVYRVAGTTA